MSLEKLCKQYNTVFLDMDGVLCDFTTAVVSGIYGRKDTRPTHYSLPAHLGVSDEEMWRRVNKEGQLFWEHLPDFPATYQLCRLAKSLPRCVILTSPSHCASSRVGKIRWLERHGLDHLELAFSPRGKAGFCNGAGDLLIDDYKVNIDAWRKSGGHTVHWAQSWSEVPRQKSWEDSNESDYAVGNPETLEVHRLIRALPPLAPA